MTCTLLVPRNVHAAAFPQEPNVHDAVYIRLTRKPPSLGASNSLVGDDGLPRRAARNARGLRRFAPQPATGHWPVATSRFESIAALLNKKAPIAGGLIISGGR